MKSRVRQSSVVPPGAAASVAIEVSSVASLRSELAIPTRVTPSMSSQRGDEAGHRVLLDPHPSISSAGPATSARPSTEVVLSRPVFGLTVPVAAVSQTSSGITSASSRSTRSQSKRLCARLVDGRVARLLRVTRTRRRARAPRRAAVAAASCTSSVATSASRSVIELLVRARTMTTPSADARRRRRGQ